MFASVICSFFITFQEKKKQKFTVGCILNSTFISLLEGKHPLFGKTTKVLGFVALIY